MNRGDVTELHFITPIVNVQSIVQHGILSHNRAQQLPHISVAMPGVQDRRREKQIPGAGHLHDYVNLYFDAHNPMLSVRRSRNNEICVLRVSSDVLDLNNVIVTDMNAARDAVRFYDVATGLAALDREKLFATFWLHQDDPIEGDRHKALKCAEVLVPDSVTPQRIRGAYVANNIALGALQALNLELQVNVNVGMFF